MVRVVRGGRTRIRVGCLEHPRFSLTPFPLVLCVLDRPMDPDRESSRSGHTGSQTTFLAS